MNFKQLFTFLLLLPTISFFGYGQDSPIVMTIDDKPVTKTEFLRTYLKNNDNPEYDKASIDDYLNLYKEFKLKVAEAEALGYDTIPSIKKELTGYLNQLAQPYLIDSALVEKMINETYNRMKHDIKASHILIKIGKNASPEDTLKAYNQMLKIRKKLVDGANFDSVLVAVKKNRAFNGIGSDLGYFSTFQMVYPFETVAYNTPVGEISMPVRTQFGYHIVIVTGKREARGTMTAAHIMKALSKNPTEEGIEAAKKQINDIYKKLQKGASFEELAKLYSDDRGSKYKGGKLPAFGSGTTRRMVGKFSNEAFALKEDGDYSKPFRSSYGFHIVKRINYKPLGSKEDMLDFIKSNLKQSGRINLSTTSFVDELKEKNGFKDKSKKSIKWFFNNIDSNYFKTTAVPLSIETNHTMFQYRGKDYTQKEFCNYINNNKLPQLILMTEYINTKYNDWVEYEVLKDEKNRLKEKYPEYRALANEYHDGILLYEIMKDKVWNKALKDSAGLNKFFKSHIQNYQWPERIKVTLYYSKDKNLVNKAVEYSKNDTLTMLEIVEKVNNTNESTNRLKVERGKYVQSENEILANRTLKKGSNAIFQKNDTYYFVNYEEDIAPEPKLLNEARGVAIQDFQKHLEKEWLKELRTKHTIKVNEDVLYSLGD